VGRVQNLQAPLDVFVGRAAELAQVAEVVSRVEAGQPVLSADGTGPAASSFAVGARLLEMVGEQATGAMAIIVDDLQWADRKSVEALTFMLRRLSVDPVIAVVIYRGPGDRLDETARRMLRSMENRLQITLGELQVGDVASLVGALTTGPLDEQAVQQLHMGTGGHPLYLRTLLSEGFDFDPRASGRLALPPSLAVAIADHLGVLPPETRDILEMLAVLNLGGPPGREGTVQPRDRGRAVHQPQGREIPPGQHLRQVRPAGTPATAALRRAVAPAGRGLPGIAVAVPAGSGPAGEDDSGAPVIG
jgi:hypothetical protein